MPHTGSCSTGYSLDLMVFRLKLLVYDLLNDDDEEIRSISSSTASAILSSNSGVFKDVVPLLASQRLITHLLNTYSQLLELSGEAMSRMTGAKAVAGVLEPSAMTTFAAVTAENTALFMVEKQNLFIDHVREAILWSQLLKQLPKDSIKAPECRALCVWVKKGLQLLAANASSETDGPLGWTSKPDVFTFGMRVFCAADVLLTWQRSFQSRPTDQSLGKPLMELLVLGREQKIHDLWLVKIEKVLVGNMLARLKTGVGASNLAAVEAALGIDVG